jgi:hypothetical protein
MSNEKRKPNWTLCVKEGERWRSIGAAWETERGNLFVKLDEGMTLRGTAMFFPYREKPPRDYSAYRQPAYGTSATKAPTKPLPPIQDAAAMVSDYMERKRQERHVPSPTPPSPSDECPDPQEPDWL